MNNFEAAKKLVELYGKHTKNNMDVDGHYAEAVAMGAAALLYNDKEVNVPCQLQQVLSK